MSTVIVVDGERVVGTFCADDGYSGMLTLNHTKVSSREEQRNEIEDYGDVAFESLWSFQRLFPTLTLEEARPEWVVEHAFDALDDFAAESVERSQGSMCLY